MQGLMSKNNAKNRIENKEIIRIFVSGPPKQSSLEVQSSTKRGFYNKGTLAPTGDRVEYIVVPGNVKEMGI